MTTLLDSPEAQELPPLSSVPDIDPEALIQEVEFFLEEIEHAKSRLQLAARIEKLDEEHYQSGCVETYGYIDKAGYGRAALVGIPNDQITDIPTIGTSAWFTSITGGHNKHTGLKLMEQGVPFIFNGAEGSYRPNRWAIPKIPANGIALTDSAISLLGLVNLVAQQRPGLIHPTDREVIGESRGGMVAMGVIALAAGFDQNIVMADLTAPCFPRRLSPADLFKFGGQAIAEPKTLLGLGGRLAKNLLWHYPQTLDWHPVAMLHHLGIGPALFSGEAGDLARMIDDDTIMHMTCFDDDYASMPDEWGDILDVSDDGNKRITLLKGSHLTIADPQTLHYILARNKAYHIMSKHPAGGKPNGQAIFDYAHMIVPEVYRAENAF